jgi:GT2 family glycosyltransferase
VREYFEKQRNAEGRIRFVHSPEHLGISGALNRALDLAAGDYIAFLDQDDRIAPFALEGLFEAVQDEPADLIYSDEDFINEQGRRVRPVFKPDWSPDLLLSCMYLSHLLAVSRKAMNKAGPFRSEFDGAQDYDLALRISDGAALVRHVPRILYHWRMHPGSTALHSSAKPYAHTAGRLALGDAIRRRGWKAVVEDGEVPNTYHVRRLVEDHPLVSIVICSCSPRLLYRCLSAIGGRTDYPNREIIVVYEAIRNRNEWQRVICRHPVKSVAYQGETNFAAMYNLGAEAADGTLLIFLHDDVTPLVSSWLSTLAGQAMRPEVGVVGARLLYPSGALQHAGMAIGVGDSCSHPGRGSFETEYWNWTKLTRNVSAVTGACLGIRKEVFSRLRGFDTAFPVHHDCDLCLRAQMAGYRVIFDAAAQLRHDERDTCTMESGFAEQERWLRRWGQTAPEDPFYSRHLTHTGEDASLRLEQGFQEMRGIIERL